jgi:hypothetical protein
MILINYILRLVAGYRLCEKKPFTVPVLMVSLILYYRDPGLKVREQRDQDFFSGFTS